MRQPRVPVHEEGACLVLTEQKLKAFEESSAASEADGEQWMGINIDDLAQLIAGARVANAAARMAELDRKYLPWVTKGNTEACKEMGAANADLVRALARYTAHGPAEVAT
jgi:hypothetical protein